ncbi:Abi family protein [Roseovarius sp. C7]|uniref:Abi family protein n=1 Tax=Roseovarius sp. C7 TaxID=3398643 RepID=UPI0039F6C9A9
MRRAPLHYCSQMAVGYRYVDIHPNSTYLSLNNTPQATGREAELNTGGLLIFRGLLNTLKFTKTPSSIEQQLQLLIQRGMDVGDHDTAKKWLETVGYYRLSAYWLPFEKPPANGNARSKVFESGATLSAVTDLYVFDRRLRVLVLEAIERVEVHVRSRWTYHMAHAHGAHAHLDHRLFSGFLNHAEQLVRLARAVEKSEETFILHHKGKYTDPYSPPLWSATELMTLGELSKWFQATKDNSIKSRVGRDLGLPTKEIVEGTLQVLALTRNIVSAVPVPLIWCIPVGFDWSDICLQHFCWRWLWRMELGLWVVWRLLNLVWATVVGPMR